MQSNIAPADAGKPGTADQVVTVGATNQAPVMVAVEITPDYPMEDLASTVLLYGLQQAMRTGGLTDESGMAYDGTIVDVTWTTGGPDCDE